VLFGARFAASVPICRSTSGRRVVFMRALLSRWLLAEDLLRSRWSRT